MLRWQLSKKSLIWIAVGGLVLVFAFVLRKAKRPSLTPVGKLPSIVFKGKDDRKLATYKEEMQGEDPLKRQDLKECSRIVSNLTKRVEPPSTTKVVWEAKSEPVTHFMVKPSFLQRVSQGQPVKLRLQEDLLLDGIVLSKGTILLGTAILRNRRCHIFVTAAHKGDRTIPVELTVVDMDFLAGLYCEDLNDDIYQETEVYLIDRALSKASFAEVAALGKKLYKRYKGRQKVLLRRDRKFYVTQPKKKKSYGDF